MTQIITPFETFYDNNGAVLNGGYIYIGTAGLNPETNPIACYWDDAFTLPAAQPIRTVNGLPVKNMSPATIYVNAASYSVTVRNSSLALIYSDLSVSGIITAATLAASGGSSLVGHIASGVGAVAASVASTLNRKVNVFQFMTAAEIADVQSRALLLDHTVAITNAATRANLTGQKLVWPAGSYRYAPSASLPISTDWEFEDVSGTIIECDTSTYTGEFFRLTGPYQIKNGWIRTIGTTKLGVGLNLSNANDYAFTGNQSLYRTRFTGFNKNINCNNIYNLTTYKVRTENAVEGFYCVPLNDAGDNGYVTDHHHIDLLSSNNDRNVYYLPALVSKNITFDACDIEAPIGLVESSHFENINGLHFNSLYAEGGSTIPAATILSCTTYVDGIYMNGTGGINFGTANNRFELKGVVTTTATDLVICTASANTVWGSFTDCLLQASGNDFSGVDYGRIENSTINGQNYSFCLLNAGGTQVELRLAPTNFPADATPRFARIIAKNMGAGNPTQLEFQTNNTSASPVTALTIDKNANVYGLAGALAMTDGFIYTPSGAGAPTGVPTAITGHVPSFYDTTNDKLYIYNGGWKSVTLA